LFFHFFPFSLLLSLLLSFSLKGREEEGEKKEEEENKG
jgi:hypothetical protein